MMFAPQHSNKQQAVIPLILIILFLILSDVQSRILAHSDSFTTINGWQVISNNAHESRIITCGTSNVLFLNNQSPVDYSTMYFKTFEIQPHYKIELQFNFWTIDQWNNFYFIVYYDNLLAHANFYQTISTTNFCEVSSLNDESFNTNFQHNHYGSTVSIGFLNNLGKFGISDFQLYIYECPVGCYSCDENGCFYQFLYIKSFDSRVISSINSIEGWYTNDIISTLVDNIADIYYHISTGNSFTKEITLIEHEAFSLYLRILVFNSQTTRIYIKIDDILVFTTIYNQGWLYIKDYFLDHMSSQQIKIQERRHLKSKIKITIEVVMIKINTSLQTWFGIRDFKLFLIPYNLVVDMKDTCDDSNIYPFDGCFSKMYECVEGCSNCIFGVCYECQGGWEYLETLRKCHPICGDSIITYTEECDDGNLISNDGCHFCKLTCSSQCQICQLGKCLQCQQTYQLIDNSCQLICYYNQDYEMQKQQGCYYQMENIIENEFQQHALLNSNFLMFTPNCLVQNYKIFNFQYQICNVLRINNCKTQYYQECMECIDGYHLERNKRNCISLCNDGIIVETEVCDDNNNIQFDKCYKCQQSCQLECKFCINEKCLFCLDGWQLIDHICVQECGDGIIALGSLEQCDDANDINKDGCYQCMWQCSPYCKQCINQQLCSKCIDIGFITFIFYYLFQQIQQLIQLFYQISYNFELIGENECKPICGDNIVIIGLEECDDGNEIPFDGCYQCQFQCEIGCTICEYGVCLQTCKSNQIIVNGLCKNESEDSPQIDEQDQSENNNDFSNYYNEYCGDGRKSKNEECDDGNNVNNDGCSNICLNELNWNLNVFLLLNYKYCF
ncbi:unnamed protein product [Paramecium pentaurelia]|uniref:Insulin-like growth factor binding protein, N-terminal n=1 Tax=Paramecium pentaurelia TaxID=43138 RepID=A0A8S1TBV6_9CILI|nr:unnamed protein product [Paramecium pentaurelia]